MLEVKKIINIDNGLIKDSNVHSDVEIISEGLVPFKENYLFGFKDGKGNIKIRPKYSDVKSFKNGLSWVFNDNNVPILITKFGEELMYVPNYLYDFDKLDKLRDKYLKENKAFSKKNKFSYEEKYKVFEENYAFGLKDLNKNIILPNNYYQIICQDGILIIDGELYDIDTFKVSYIVNISYNNSVIKKTFSSYNEMENYIKSFTNIFEKQIAILHEKILRNIFLLSKNNEENSLEEIKAFEIKEQNEVLSIFKDADKKSNKLIKRS